MLAAVITMVMLVSPASADSKCSQNNHTDWHTIKFHNDNHKFKSVVSYKQNGVWYNSYIHRNTTHGYDYSPRVCG